MSKSGTMIGLRGLVYALLQDDPISGTASYQTPVSIPGAISANVNPNGSNAMLFADDGPYDAASTIGGITVDINVADLPIDAQAVILGHTYAGGVLIRKSSDVPPWLAIGFKSLKSNGKYRYTWLAKGKFVAGEQANETKGDSINFQTPKISGSFVRRDCDDEWQRHIDEDDVNFMAAMSANWFTGPYGLAADLVAPGLTTTTPAANATAVATSSTFTWIFTEALALTTLTSEHFMLVLDTTGVAVPGTLSVNAARTQVVFTPTAALTAATAYRAIVTTGVKDLAGNRLSAGVATKFTTA